MPHLLIMTGTDHTTGARFETFDYFEPISQSRGGWCWLQLVRSEAREQLGTPNERTHTEVYDPAVHDGGSHYMSYPWRARTRLHRGRRMYTLYGAYGNPGSRTRLEEVIG